MIDILNDEEIAKLSYQNQTDYLKLIRDYEEIKRYNQLNFFEPYPFQSKFYSLGKDEPVRALIAANRVGKTYSASIEVAMHLTGKYPEWWDGKRWDKPIRAIATSVTSSQVRDVLQNEFVGTPNRDLVDEVGTGVIPRDCIDVDKSAKARDGAFSELAIKHVSGGYSTLKFFSYAQGMEPLQGWRCEIAYVDEQDKNNFDLIFSELVKRISTTDGLMIATFTPLQGVTNIVREFWDPDGAFHSGLVNAGWDDVTHLTEKAKTMMLNATPPHLRDAVTKGIPVLGSGAVYNIGESEIIYDDVEIGDEWPRICGVDVGFTTDPTAAIFVAKDPSTGLYYVYDEYGDVDNNTWNASQHVGHFHAKNCGAIPMVYDSAAKAKLGATGKAVTELWREMGLNVSATSFSNPKHLSTNVSSYKSISVGLTRIFEMMATGKIKVHAKCKNFWREFRGYSFDDKGIPNGKDNHWMDSFRYAVMSAEKGLMEVPGRSQFGDYQDDDDYNYNIL